MATGIIIYYICSCPSFTAAANELLATTGYFSRFDANIKLCVGFNGLDVSYYI
jgi:hypothetical protein